MNALSPRLLRGAHRTSFALAALFALSSLGADATAQGASPEAFAHPDGTTHWYEVVATPQGITWRDAARAAAERGGYLATITSAAENTHVFGLLDDAQYWQANPGLNQSEGPWLGGRQQPGSTEPSAGWAWNELEGWSASFWRSGQPDDDSGANRVHFAAPLGTRAATWGDALRTRTMPGYVVEYAGPFVKRTVGLIQRQEGSFDGYTLVSPLSSQYVYLVDERGRQVHHWVSRHLPGAVTFLRDNGNLVRAGDIGNPLFPAGNGGVIEELAWDSTPVWTYTYSTNKYSQHHDVDVLPNGNYLILVWEEKSAAEAIAAGRDPSTIADGRIVYDRLIEVQPTGPTTGKIVWEWDLWDQLVQDFDSSKANYGDPRDPGLVDINFDAVLGDEDWTHSNAVSYNAALDQIAISVRHFSEVWIIDHSTTTAEARTGSGGRSGKGGRILYRWGNPQTYRAGTANDKKLFWQHDCTWVPGDQPGEWHIMVFNNGNGRPVPAWSSVDEWKLPTPDANGVYPRPNAAFGPTQLHWDYTAPVREEMFAPFISGAQRLPNGNTLVTAGVTGWGLEVTDAKQVVWEYKNMVAGPQIFMQGSDNVPVPFVFRMYRYAADHPALKGRVLKATEPAEGYDSVLLIEGSTAPHFADIGTKVEFALRSRPQDAGKFYLLASSLTKSPLQLDYRFLRVGYDAIFDLSVGQGAPGVFQGFFGTLSSVGRSKAWFDVPNLPALRGLELFTAGMVFDPAARSGVGMLSNQVRLRLR
jgi:hypothetical protein